MEQIKSQQMILGPQKIGAAFHVIMQINFFVTKPPISQSFLVW